MAVKASAQITLNSVVDIKATYRYYLLQSSTLAKPAVPTTNPPSSAWDDTEPTYTSGSTNSLYYVDLTVFSDDKFSYSAVSLSTSYEAAKEAYNKANNAQNTADSVNNDLKNNYYTKTQTDAAITVKGDSIISTVSATYATKNEAVISPKIDGDQTRIVRINNAIADSIENVKLYGKTTQFTTTGKNLIPCCTVGNAINNNGLTATFDETGCVVSGTPTADWASIYYSTTVGLSPGTYYISGGAANHIYAQIGITRNGTTTYYSCGKSFTLYGDETRVGIGIQVGTVSNTGTLTNYRFEPMIVAGSTPPTSYEPYTGGIASPNPDYPQELESVGASGSIDATVAGKNLVNSNNFTAGTSSGITFTKVASGGVHVSGTSTAYANRSVDLTLPKGRYTVSGVNSVSNKAYVYAQKLCPDGTKKTIYANAKGNNSFDVDGTETWVRCFVQVHPNVTVDTILYPMVEAGETETDYEPYKETQTLTASTPNGLPGIPVSSGGNYTDENGQPWICDEIDFARGVYVRRIAEICLDGSVPPNQYVQTGDAMRFGWTGKSGFTPKDYTNAELAMCNRFTPSVSPIWNNYLDGGICAHTGGNIYLRYDAVTSPEAMAEYLADNPVVYLYVMETPIETALSAEELAAFADLTNEPGTVTVYSEAALDVELSGIASASSVGDAQNAADQAQSTADTAAANIAKAETIIQQLEDSISSLVRKNGESSMLRQEEDGLWYFDITNLDKLASDTATGLGNLEGVVLDANGEIDVLKTTAAALQQRTEYVRSYVDENDQPCLELGEGDSVFKVRITNTEIQFAEGTDVPAKLNRKMLVIEKAMVKNELQFGDDEVLDGVWIWKRRENGNLGLSWKTVR